MPRALPGLSNNDAIVVGLGRVGRIISSAALLLTITLLSFANGLSFMKMFGIGTALAIVIDATVIRGVGVSRVSACRGRSQLVGATAVEVVARTHWLQRSPEPYRDPIDGT